MELPSYSALTRAPDRLRLIIQIPCLNEAETLPETLAALPRHVPGIDVVEWLIVNDGSTDGTVEVARACGVDHIIDLPKTKGLANAFRTGLRACLEAGADIIVNTDADNQYCADDIPKLLEPILSGRAEIVIGARPIAAIEHFSLTKRVLQRLGTWVVRAVSGSAVDDAPSGFRAMSRAAAMQMIIFSTYSYTLEMIIRAGRTGMTFLSVPIRVNPYRRPSRLAKSTTRYVLRSAATIVRIFAVYRPMRFFALLGAVPLTAGCLLAIRWVLLYWYEYPKTGRTHVPSLIAASVLIIAGLQVSILGFIADLLAANRVLIEDVRMFVARRWFDRANVEEPVGDDHDQAAQRSKR